MTNKAQGSISIRRLRNGDMLILNLNVSKALFQFVDDEGNPKPNWSTDVTSRPTITPTLSTANGATPTLKGFTWYHDGAALSFNEDNLDTTGVFQVNPTTGALTLVGNLASAVNNWNDTLTFKCQCILLGVTYNLEKSIDVEIMRMGAGSYKGLIETVETQLGEEAISTVLNTSLWAHGELRADYYVKWYKNSVDSDPLAASGNGKTLTVTRAMVDGVSVFIAEFYLDATYSTVVERAGISISDLSDDYKVIGQITSENKEVAPNQPVTVEGRLVNMRTNTEVDLSTLSPTWNIELMRSDNWQQIRTSAQNNITISTDDTDVNGVLYDVEVVFSVTW